MLLLNQLKKDCLYLKASIVYFLVGFLITPILLGLLYGLMFFKMSTVDIELEDLQVYVAVNNQEEKYAALGTVFEQDFIKIHETHEEEVKERYKDKNSLGIVMHEQGMDIYNHNGTNTEKMILTKMLRYSNLYGWKSQSGEELVPVEILDQKPVLSSYESFVVSVYMGMSFFIAITFASYFIKERQQSMMGRIFSMNMHKLQFYLVSVGSIFIISLALVSLHSYVAYKLVMGLDFNPLRMLVINTIHAGFIAAFYGISISLFYDEKVYKTYITPIVMVIFILGGSFFPIDMFGKPFAFVHLMPNYELFNMYKGVLLEGNGGLISQASLMLMGMSILLLGVGALRFPKIEIR